MQKSKNSNKQKSRKNQEIFLTKEQVRNMFKSKETTKMKFTDTSLILIPGSGVINNTLACNMPPIGTGINSTAGGLINIHSFELRYFIVNSATALPMGVRITVNQTIGNSVPVQGDVLQNVSSYPLALTSALSYSNQGKTVKTLRDVHIDTSPSWNASQQGSLLSIKPAVSKTIYSATDGTWSTGLPYVHMWFSVNAVSGLSIAYYFRMWFTDA
jgi:hypothetical protein